MTPDDEARFARLAQQIEPGSTLRRAWALPGGVSAQVTALEIVRPGGAIVRWVARRHGPVDLAHNPQIAADEFRLLQLLYAAGLPVPQPLYLGASGTVFPTPVLVVDYIEGQTEFAPADLPAFLRQLAAQLARIHQIDPAQVDLSFLPRLADRWADRLRDRPATPDAFFEEERIRDLLAAAWPLPPRNVPVLLHGDYWPGNIFWRAGRLVAVLDWEDAAVGDPLADLANSRLEILWAFGPAAMAQFTEAYRALTVLDVTDLPYWDLCLALRPMGKFTEWAADAAAAATMRERLRWFITQALERIVMQ